MPPFLALWCLPAALAVACAPGAPPCPAGRPDGAVLRDGGAVSPAPGWGFVEVWVSPAFEPPARASILAELLRLHALGPAFVVAAAPAPGAVAVRPFRGDCLTDAAHVLPGSRVVELDLSCMGGDDAAAVAVGHSIGHALGLSHVCAVPGELLECSPVGYGPALMGPRLRRATGLGEVFSGALGHPEPTSLDRAELLRVYSLATSPPAGRSPDGGP